MRPWAALGALLLHLGLGYWLLHAPILLPAIEADPFVMRVVFLPARRLEPSHRLIGSPGRSRPILARKLTAIARHTPGPEQVRRNQDQPEQPLRLALPSTLTAVTIAPSDPLSKRASIDYTPTRFDGQWVSDGTALEQLAWRHPAVAMALAAFGGNRHICTDEDKRQGMRGCAPDIDAGIARAPGGE